MGASIQNTSGVSVILMCFHSSNSFCNLCALVTILIYKKWLGFCFTKYLHFEYTHRLFIRGFWTHQIHFNSSFLNFGLNLLKVIKHVNLCRTMKPVGVRLRVAIIRPTNYSLYCWYYVKNPSILLIFRVHIKHFLIGVFIFVLCGAGKLQMKLKCYWVCLNNYCSD